MAAWFDIVNENGVWTLVDTGRLEELVQGMPYPKRQGPFWSTLLGAQIV